MEPNKHYLRVGVFIVGISVALALFAVWIVSTGKSDDVRYRIYFAESVSGLSLGSPVKFRGVDVGTVEDIRIDKVDSRRIRVTIRILKDTPVKEDSLASLRLQGITGAVFVELSPGTREAPELAQVTRDGKIPVIKSESSSINALMNQLPAILDKISKFGDQMNKLASDENIEALSRTLTSLDLVLASTNSIAADIKEVTAESKDNTKEIMLNLRKASRDISTLTDSVKDDPSQIIFPREEQGIEAP